MHVRNALGTHWHVLDPQAARRYHEEALGIAEELGDESGQVSALNRLSLVLANELEFAEAVELGERALQIASRAGDEHCRQPRDGQPQVRRAATRRPRAPRGALHRA